jgi:hypothetical protein
MPHSLKVLHGAAMQHISDRTNFLYELYNKTAFPDVKAACVMLMRQTATAAHSIVFVGGDEPVLNANGWIDVGHYAHDEHFARCLSELPLPKWWR